MSVGAPSAGAGPCPQAGRQSDERLAVRRRVRPAARACRPARGRRLRVDRPETSRSRVSVRGRGASSGRRRRAARPCPWRREIEDDATARGRARVAARARSRGLGAAGRRRRVGGSVAGSSVHTVSAGVRTRGRSSTARSRTLLAGSSSTRRSRRRACARGRACGSGRRDGRRPRSERAGRRRAATPETTPVSRVRWPRTSLVRAARSVIRGPAPAGLETSTADPAGALLADGCRRRRHGRARPAARRARAAVAVGDETVVDRTTISPFPPLTGPAWPSGYGRIAEVRAPNRRAAVQVDRDQPAGSSMPNSPTTVYA